MTNDIILQIMGGVIGIVLGSLLLIIYLRLKDKYLG